MPAAGARPASPQAVPAARRIWVVTDGRAGNESQALGLAEAVAELVPAEIRVERLPMRPGLQLPPNRLWLALPPRAGLWPFLAYREGARGLRPPWPDMVIGAGRRSAPLVAALRRLARRDGGRLVAVQVMHPRLPPRHFDLVLVPRHSRISGPNVVTTFGALGRISSARLAAAAKAWAPRLGHLPHPRVAVLIGGPSGAARFGSRARRAVLAAIETLLDQGAGVMVTPSRRTPADLRAELARRLAGRHAWVWDMAGENPYFALLGLADAILVTEDSVSMASEAAATGRPVYVLPVERVRAKIARFHAELRAAGYTRPFAGRIERWSYEPLRETERVAPLVAALLEPAPGEA